jgi:hypothetical protein
MLLWKNLLGIMVTGYNIYECTLGKTCEKICAYRDGIHFPVMLIRTSTFASICSAG